MHKGEQKGIIVTKAKAGDSWHNYGLAIDIVIILDTNNDGLFETASFKIDKYWITVANYLKSQRVVMGRRLEDI